MMGWKLFSGEPHKSKVARGTARLLKDKLIEKTRAGYFELTDKGLNVLGSK